MICRTILKLYVDLDLYFFSLREVWKAQHQQNASKEQNIFVLKHGNLGYFLKLRSCILDLSVCH